MNWSPQQEAIFEWFSDPSGQLVASKASLCVEALAGTGKTTTILEGCRRAPENRILVCAFNKRIAEELQTKARDSRIEAKTLHAVGFAIVRRFRERVRVASGSRGPALATAVCGEQAPDACVGLVAKAINLAREMAPLAKEWRELLDIVLAFDLEPSEDWLELGWDADTVARYAFDGLALAKKPTQEIDFSDMIFLPVACGWAAPAYDLVVVDEAQDMNASQLLLAERIARGRKVVVGDSHQAIYGFRGADSGSLGRLATAYGASVLPLSVTYRCPQLIVRAAQEFVPEYTAAPSAPGGRMANLEYEKLFEEVQANDAILSRKNADLISCALRLIRSGKSAKVIGRDIAESLRALLREIATGKAKNSIPELLARAKRWQARQFERIDRQGSRSAEAAAAKKATVADKVETLVALAEGAASVPELTGRIDRLFTDAASGAVISCASVHRSKGLEWQRVYLLDWTFKHNSLPREAPESARIEERNIRYVALTRAQRELTYVYK